jgi:hypothetical protein
MTDPSQRLLDSARDRWARALASERTNLVRTDLVIADVSVRLDLIGARLVEVVLPALEVHERLDHDHPQVHVRAYDAAAAGVPLPEVPALGDQRFIEWVATDGTTKRWSWQPDHGMGLLADPGTAGVGHLAVVADGQALPWWEHSAPLRQLLAWAMVDAGRHFLHAAAVGSPDGVVLLAGPGGTGKSSTAVSSLLAGLHYLGDDYCILTLDGGPRAHTLYGTAKLMPDQIPLVDTAGALAGHVVHAALPGEPKTTLLPSRWRPDLLVPSAPILAVVVPSQDGALGLEPISAATALRHLAPTSLLQLTGRGDGDLRALGDLVRSVPAYRLGLDTDRAANPPRLARLLEELQR